MSHDALNTDVLSHDALNTDVLSDHNAENIETVPGPLKYKAGRL
jgi:hypothetical protein